MGFCVGADSQCWTDDCYFGHLVLFVFSYCLPSVVALLRRIAHLEIHGNDIYLIFLAENDSIDRISAASLSFSSS